MCAYTVNKVEIELYPVYLHFVQQRGVGEARMDSGSAAAVAVVISLAIY